MIVEIATVRIALTGLSPSLAAAARDRYRSFLSEAGAPALSIALTASSRRAHAPDGDPTVERLADRRFSVRYGALVAELDLGAGHGLAEIPDSVYVVDSLLRIAMSLLLLERGGLLVHGASVELDGGALVCFGPSGAGKTTVARSVAADAVLCDELTAIYPDGARVLAAGTPFHGDLAICSPRALPLAALCRLQQADGERLVALSAAGAVRELLASTLFFCRDEALVLRVVDAAAAIVKDRTAVLQFRLSSDVLQLVRQHLEQHPLPSDPQTAGASPRR
ncbi:MAG TPA: hypothetical protein VGL86_16960 [Polyangia bacterium]